MRKLGIWNLVTFFLAAPFLLLAPGIEARTLSACINSFDQNHAIERCTAAIASKTLLKTALVRVYSRRAAAHYYLCNHNRALADLRHALHLDPADIVANNDLAWLLSTLPFPSARSGVLAIEHGLKAVAASPTANFTATLAAAYAEAGQFERAIAEQETAVALARQENSSLLERFELRLELYRNRRPFREWPCQETSSL